MRRPVTGVVLTGASVLAADPDLVGAGRFGLLTNFTGTMPDLTRTVDALLAAGVNVTALFGPEHGLRGSVQAGETETDDHDAETGLPLFETYLLSPGELDALIERSGVDALIFDMQDLGVRFYTYIWSLYDVMLSAARTGRRFIVLDRPNPLGGTVTDGPRLDPAFASFVGRVDIPVRHGLTAGELAGLFNEQFLPAEVGTSLDLQVIGMRGWERTSWFDQTGLPWVAPSPNMPTLETALAFCGTGLFEGTNVSEGRGTTRPFEMLGAPFLDGALAPALRDLGLPGVLFRDALFTPTFHKYAGQTLRGVQLHVVDRERFEPVRCAASMMATIAEIYSDDFSFLRPGERVDATERGFPIDRLWGSAWLRESVGSGADLRPLLPAASSPAAAYGSRSLLYP